MRIVTRPDFDGVVCAVLLLEAENETIDHPVKWVQPDEISSGSVHIRKGDILANLPYDPRCSLWFDHHYSNRIEIPFNGVYKLTPSAARIVFEYYRHRLKRDYTELVHEADRIDSAQLDYEEIRNPEKNPYFLLSLTISDGKPFDRSYVDRVVDLCRKYDIDTILQDRKVKRKCREVLEGNEHFVYLLKTHTLLKDHVSVTDFRPIQPAPKGNRFLVYTLYPKANISLEIRVDDHCKEKVRVSIGRNIFNRSSNINIGGLLSRFGGGGHRDAGGCSFHASDADAQISRIIEILLENEPNE